MTRGVRKYLVSSVVLVALIAVAGCSHYLMAVRQPWRDEAELACIEAGVPQEIPGRVRIATIHGPDACGIEYPLRVSEIGEKATPVAYDEPPSGATMAGTPAIRSSTLPAMQSAPAQDGQAAYGEPADNAPPYGPPPQARYASAQYGEPAAGTPMSLTPPADVPQGAVNLDALGGPPHPYYGAPPPAPVAAEPDYTPRPTPPPGLAPGSASTPAGPVELKPTATLACPIVSALDKWVATVVQPAAFRWFGKPVVEIKQIGSYACREMVNGNPDAPISEHAFGNALDIAEFDLADGHRITVQYGWHGTPEEQGFLHDVQGGACRDFTTVLAPGANIYHYNHIHVDLMRRQYRPFICEPAAIPGAVAAARARAYAARHGYPDITGSIGPAARSHRDRMADDFDNRPLAVPGDD